MFDLIDPVWIIGRLPLLNRRHRRKNNHDRQVTAIAFENTAFRTPAYNAVGLHNLAVLLVKTTRQQC